MIGHTVERELIHFFSAPGLLMGLFLLFGFLKRRHVKQADYIPDNWRAQLVYAALGVGLFAAGREAYDVGVVHDPWAKSYIDLTFWSFGLFMGIKGIIKLLFLRPPE